MSPSIFSLTHDSLRKITNWLRPFGFCFTFITAGKRRLGQGNIFTGICLSGGGRVSKHVMGSGVCIPACNGAGVSAQGSLCPEGVSVRGSLSRGVSTEGVPALRGVYHTPSQCRHPHRDNWSRRYVSYWNAFLFTFIFSVHSQVISCTWTRDRGPWVTRGDWASMCSRSRVPPASHSTTTCYLTDHSL